MPLVQRVMARFSVYRRGVFLFLAVLLLWGVSLQAAEPEWLEIRSPHFVVITDTGEKRGRELALRFEQMRSVFGQLLARKRLNMPVPLTIFALKSDQQYLAMAPLRNGKPIAAPGFLVPGEDHQFIVLNGMEEEAWRAVAHEFAHLLLNYNYPSTQAWFDEGFAEYFSSLRTDNKQVEIGGDPEAKPASPNSTQSDGKASKSLTDLLNSPAWLEVPALFKTQHDTSGYEEGQRRTLFYAQSWITMHYLLSNSKLGETGTYFELVQNQNAPVEDAIRQAYGMTAAQFEQAVKDYFHSVTQPGQDKPAATGASGGSTLINRFVTPVGPDDVEITSKTIPEADARAQLAEVMLRLPEHREQGLQEARAVLDLKDKKGQPVDNEIAHRALAWAHMDHKEFPEAAQELGTAAALNPQDTWIRYYLSLLKYKSAQANHQELQGLANMLQDLKATVDWYPDFAEAYHMLAVARLEGGGTASALDAIYGAIGLSPRNEQYVLTLGQIQLGAKKWDAAKAIFERLAASHNAQIAAAAQRQLDEFSKVRKYGIAGQGPARAPQASPFDELEQEAQKRAQAETETGPDKRPTQYFKGRLVKVDCSGAPAAVVTVASGSRSIKLHTADYKSVLVIGADEFSCEWADRAVAVNYKSRGGVDGDLVSVELQ